MCSNNSRHALAPSCIFNVPLQQPELWFLSAGAPVKQSGPSLPSLCSHVHEPPVTQSSVTRRRLPFCANVTFNGSSVAAETQGLSVGGAVATSLACGHAGRHGSGVVVYAERTEQVVSSG